MTLQIATPRPRSLVTADRPNRHAPGLLSLESATSAIVFISYGGLIFIAIAIMAW